MIIFYPSGFTGAGLHLRPYPLITFSNSVVNNKLYDASGGHISIPATTEITLNGTILAGQNDIFFTDSTKPTVFGSGGLDSILYQRNRLEEILKSPKLEIEICNLGGGVATKGRFSLSSLNFEEGTWVDSCKYSATLTADYLQNGTMILGLNKDYNTYISEYGGIIENFQETWSLEPEEGFATTSDPDTNSTSLRIYRLNRNATVTGKVSHDSTPNNGLPWENAKLYFHKYNQSQGFPQKINAFASGLINLTGVISGYNHIVTENVDKTAGTYSVNETWIISPSASSGYENYNVSVSQSTGDSVKVSVEGTVKGLTPTMSSGSLYTSMDTTNSAYDGALFKYNSISNTGKFDINSFVFKRAQKTSRDALNPTPVSVSVGANEFNGEITYNVEYDARPANFISGSLSENISINDTYPGDFFAVIPVIGRPTGPVLQNIGGRTEYVRNVTIEAVMASGYGGDIKSQLAFSKPSLLPGTRDSINNIIYALSPSGEPGIRKYFLSPPQETWNPTERRYTLNLTWTYELNQ